MRTKTKYKNTRQIKINIIRRMKGIKKEPGK